jgi:hypothetical protein
MGGPLHFGSGHAIRRDLDQGAHMSQFNWIVRLISLAFNVVLLWREGRDHGWI